MPKLSYLVILSTLLVVYSCHSNSRLKNVKTSKSAETKDTLYVHVKGSDTLQLILKEGLKRIRLDSNDTKGYYLTAAAYNALGDTVQALKYYDYLLKINPNDFEGRMGRGILFNNNNKEDLAIDDLKAAIRLGKPNVYVQFELGYALYKLNRLTEAEVHFSEVIAIDKACHYENSSWAYYYRGIIRIQNKNDTAGGCEDLNKAFFIDPSFKNMIDKNFDCLKW